MKYLLIISLASVSLLPLSGKPSIDSLIQVWDQSQAPERYMLSLSLGDMLAADSLDRALLFFAEAIEIAATHDDSRAEAEARMRAGDVLDRFGEDLEDWRESVNYYLRANILCQEAHDPDCQAKTWYLAGKGYLRFDQYERALDNLFRAAAIYGAMKDSISLTACYLSIGDVYRANGALKQAMDYGQKAMNIADQLQQDSLIGKIKFNIGVCHQSMGNHHAARVYLEEALRIFTEDRGPDAMAAMVAPLNRIGESLCALQEYAKAENIFIRAIELADAADDQAGMADSYAGLASMFLARKRFSKARAFLDSSTAISEERQLQKQLLKNFSLYIELFMEMGEVKELAGYNTKYQRLREKLQAIQQRDILIKQHAWYEFQRLTHEAELNDKNLATQKIELTAKRAQMQVAILIGVLLLVLAAFSYRQSIAKQRVNSQLEQLVSQRTEDLQVANHELDTFAYRTAHDIRGPVARLLGLCQLAIHESDHDKAKHYIDLLNNEATSMDVMLHRFLEVNHLKHIKEDIQAVNLQTMLAEVLEACKETEGFDEVDIRTRVEPGLFLKTKPRIFKIMLKNIVENSINFRYKHGKMPAYISIMGKKGKDHVVIRVLDNGIGIDDRVAPEIFNMFYRGTHASTGLGLGLYATKQAADLLDAKVTFVSDNRLETEFTIEIPLA